MIAAGIMEPYGMHIDCVSSGKEAVELVRKAETIYDIIFMDYMMPEMDGIEATRIIRKEIGTRYAKTVPIIALTAAELDGKESLFLNNGFNAFLEKPIDIIRLDAEINRWIRGV
jgi:CheY-like chemotaxis protein